MTAAVLALGPSPAKCQGIDLSWNDCGLYGLQNMNFACNSNVGSNTIVASFTPPSAGLPEFTGLSATLMVRTSASVLPDWWRHGASGCRGTTGLSTSFDFTSNFNCEDFFAGQATGGFVWDNGYCAPDRARLRIQCAVPFDNRGPIQGGNQYYAFKVNLLRSKTVGASACDGCTAGACIGLMEIQLFQSPGQAYDPVITAPLYRNFVTWQGGVPGCPGAVNSYYVDADGDGYGNPNLQITGTSPFYCPSGSASNASDCDDTRNDIHPGATDICDGIDNDCNGTVDDNQPVGPSGIVGWWRGEANANDATGNGYNGTLNGASFAAGEVAQAFTLDGVDDHVANLGTAATFSFLENTGVFSIEGWIKLNDPNVPREQTIAANAPTTVDKGFYFGVVNSGGQHQLQLAVTHGVSGNATIDSRSPTGLITDTNWHHVAATGDGSHVTFYIDGVAYAGSGTMGTKASGDATRAVDLGWDNVGSYFGGRIDELAIYNRALIPSEIKAIYDGGSAGRCGLTASPAKWSSLWQASTGYYPDASCPWVLTDAADPESPVLSADYLTLSTSTVDEYIYYGQTSYLAIPPDTLRILARLRVLSDFHLPNNARRGAAIAFTVGRDSGNILFFGRDTAFLWAGSYAQQGPTALVDTDDGFHVYEIRVVHRSAVTVYQDGAQILTGSIMVDPNFADAAFLWWGDGTSAGSGDSQWSYVLHNASTINCGAIVGVSSEPRARGATNAMIALIPYPNPNRGRVTFVVRASALEAGKAIVRIYDVSGRMVKSMSLGAARSGAMSFRWEGDDDRGRPVSSGTYLLALEAEGRQRGSVKATIVR
jgi:hypothetical protein